MAQAPPLTLIFHGKTAPIREDGAEPGHLSSTEVPDGLGFAYTGVRRGATMARDTQGVVVVWFLEWFVVAPLFFWFFFSLLFGKLGGVKWGKAAQRDMRLQQARKMARREAEDRLLRRYHLDD